MAEKAPIHHVSFSSEHLLASTFLRFQEHYESPRFRGKVFDLETFMDWYASVRRTFSYLTDWGGFNIPSRILEPFRAGRFDPLTRKEQALLRLFDGIPEPFYVIGTVKAQPIVLAHEFVHGMFYCRPDYAAGVRKIIDAHEPVRIFRVLAKNDGYDPSVFADEANAYALTDGDKRFKAYPKMTKELGDLFQRTFGWSVRDRRNWARIPRLIHHRRFPKRLDP